MRYEYVVFDLDGTLLNTLEDLADSVNYALGLYGYAGHTLEEYRYFVGNGTAKLVERSLPKDAQDSFDNVFAKFTEHYKRHSADKTAPYDGIKEMLAELRRMGVKTGVITNKPHDIAGEVVAGYFGEGAFDFVRGLSADISPKPAPDGVFEVMKKIGAQPEKTLYIGDSDVDMQTAANAGLDSCGVLWGFRDEKTLADNNAGYIVDTPAKIVEIVRGDDS